MTAIQVMKEIQAMTPEERGQIVDFLRQLENGQGSLSAREDQVDQISDQILERHADLMQKLAQ